MLNNFGLRRDVPSARGARGLLAKEGVYASSGKRRGSGSIHRDQQRQPLFASAPPPPPADMRSGTKASSNEWNGIREWLPEAKCIFASFDLLRQTWLPYGT